MPSQGYVQAGHATTLEHESFGLISTCGLTARLGVVSGRPRVAYLILSHKLPDQVTRLASILRRGSRHASIVIHHDDHECSVNRVALRALDAQLIEPPSRVQWGDRSHLEMTLRCLRWLLVHCEFDWLVVLSGQDYPIRAVADIELSLAVADVDAFIETRLCERPPFHATVDEFSSRYYYRWLRLPVRLASPLAFAAAELAPFVRLRSLPAGTWVGVPSVRVPFSASFVCHTGSDWFTLSRAAVQGVDRFVREQPHVLRYYRRTLLPTESFVQTVLANESSLRLSGDYRRYLTFDDHDDPTGPRVLGIDDLDSILTSPGDFARKFDHTVDETVLDAIDQHVHSI